MKGEQFYQMETFPEFWRDLDPKCFSNVDALVEHIDIEIEKLKKGA